MKLNLLYGIERPRPLICAGFLTTLIVNSVGWDLKLLTSLKTPLEYQVYKTKHNVITTKQGYLKDLSQKWKYPAVKNLDHHLSQISDERHCLITLDNIQGINLYLTENPVLLRKPVPLILRDNLVGNGLHYPILSGVDTTSFENFSLPRDSLSAECPLSKFLSGFDSHVSKRYNDVCLMLKVSKYFLHARPSNCRIHVTIFPSAFFVRGIWLLPKQTSLEISKSVFPTTVPRIVTLIHLNATRISLPTLMLWVGGAICQEDCPSYRFRLPVNHIKLSRQVTIEESQTYIFTLMPVVKEKISRLSRSVGNIIELVILRLCMTCPMPGTDKLGTSISRDVVSTWDTNEAKRLAYPSPDTQQVWKFEDTSHENNLLAIMMHQIEVEECEWKNIKHLTSQSLSSNLTLMDKLAFAHGDLWKSVMKNFTVFYRGTKRLRLHSSCSNLYDESDFDVIINLSQVPYIRSLYIFPYYIQDKRSSLRFIGCGTKGLTAIQFAELTNVFCGSVWCAILICIFSVSFFLAHIQKPRMHTLTGTLTSVLKVLVEQGNPFPPSLTNDRNLQICLACFLLASIILNNGYKNTNVYNMVTPRKPIVYEHLSDLLQDDFSIYMRSISVRHMSFLEYFNRSGKTGDLNEIVQARERSYYLLESEILSRLENYRKVAQPGSNDVEDPTIVKAGVKDVVKYHPSVLELYEKELPSYAVLQLQLQLSSVYKSIQVEENLILRGAIKECKKSAVILPDQVCGEYLEVLRNEDKVLNIFVGKEYYSDIDWMYQVKGFIPPYLITRFNAASHSGIFEWWMELMTEKYSHIPTENFVKPASMDGNVVVIFVVWTCGTVLAAFTFSIELYKYLVLSVLKKLSIYRESKN